MPVSSRLRIPMNPVVLAIDTSGTSCSVALLDGLQVHARRATVGNAHSQFVLDMLRAVLTEAAVALDRCHVIAYAAGPGSFTGLRVACAVAQGLAFGVGRPVVPVGTLEAIAHSVGAAHAGPAGEMLVAMDARMGEVYWALLGWTNGWTTAMVAPGLASPAVLRHRIAAKVGRPIALGAGNAWSVHGDAMNGLVARVVERDAADAIDVAYLGRIAYLDGRSIAPGAASPLYVRDDVAQTTAEREARRQTSSGARLASAAGRRE